MVLYDPKSDDYLDTADARAARDQTFQQCSDCRLCVKYCYSFKSLFKFTDEFHDDDPTALSPDEHEHIVSECFQCKLCYINCPYTPEKGQDWKIDFPALMLRSLAIMQKENKVGRGAKFLAQTDKIGKLGTATSFISNPMNKLKPARAVMEKATGISRKRLLPSFAKVRFSKWFRKNAGLRLQTGTDQVALFPTCLVEYQQPEIGKAAVAVCEHNDVACELPPGQVCCGMPYLDAGDVDKFRELANQNIAALAPAAKEGRKILVPQPTCAYVLRKEYPEFVGTEDAKLVADATRDVSEYFIERKQAGTLNTEFQGKTYETISWHAACHYRAQQIGPKSKELMELTGAKVTAIERCSAIDGTWGLRAENLDQAVSIAKPLMDQIRKLDAELVVGDCHLANTAINEQTARVPMHPIQVLAQAYGEEI